MSSRDFLQRIAAQLNKSP